jgi:hypothetical protein
VNVVRLARAADEVRDSELRHDVLGRRQHVTHTWVGCGTGGEVNPVDCAGAVEQRLRGGGEVGGSGGGGRRASEVNCHDCIFAD